MINIQYSLYVTLNGKSVYWFEKADSCPRFSVGDSFGLRPLDPMYDHDARAIVTDVLYDLAGDASQPLIRLYLRIREESDAEANERHLKFPRVSGE